MNLPNPTRCVWLLLVHEKVQAFLIYDNGSIQDIAYFLVAGGHDSYESVAKDIFASPPTDYACFQSKLSGPTLRPQNKPLRLTLHPNQLKRQLLAIQSEYNAWIANTPSKGCSNHILNEFASYPECLVYELLQNSVDSGATSVSYRISTANGQSKLVVSHNGRPFNLADVHGLTNFATSSKIPNGNTIGHKGIGFKSIFSLAQTVVITSGSLSFQYTKKRTEGGMSWIDFRLLSTNITPPSRETTVELSLRPMSFELEAIKERLNDLIDSKALLILSSLDKPLRTISVVSDDMEEQISVGTPVWNRIKNSKVDYCVTRWKDSQCLLVREGNNASDFVSLCVTIPKAKDKLNHGHIYSFLPLVGEKNASIVDIHAPFALDSRRESIQKSKGSGEWERVAYAHSHLMRIVFALYHNDQALLRRLYWRLIPPTSLREARRYFNDIFSKNELTWTLPANSLQHSSTQAIMTSKDAQFVDTSYVDLSDLTAAEMDNVLPLLPRISMAEYPDFWGSPGKVQSPIEEVKTSMTDFSVILRDTPNIRVSSAQLVDYRWSQAALKRIDELCGPRNAPKESVSNEAHKSLSALLRIVLTHEDATKHCIYRKVKNEFFHPLNDPSSFVTDLRDRRWISIMDPSAPLGQPKFNLFNPNSVIYGHLTDQEVRYFSSHLEWNKAFLPNNVNALRIPAPHSTQEIVIRLLQLKRYSLNLTENLEFYLQSATSIYRSISIPSQPPAALNDMREKFHQHELIYNPKSASAWLSPSKAFFDSRDHPEGLEASYPDLLSTFLPLGVPTAPDLVQLVELARKISRAPSRTHGLEEKVNGLRGIYALIGRKLDAWIKSGEDSNSERSSVTEFLEDPLLLNVKGAPLDARGRVFALDHSDLFAENVFKWRSHYKHFIHPSLLQSMNARTRAELQKLFPNIQFISFPKLDKTPPTQEHHRLSRLQTALDELNKILQDDFENGMSAASTCPKFDFHFGYHRAAIPVRWIEDSMHMQGACFERTFYLSETVSSGTWTALWLWMLSTEEPFPSFSKDFHNVSIAALALTLGPYFESFEENDDEDDEDEKWAEKVSTLHACREFFLHSEASPDSSPLETSLRLSPNILHSKSSSKKNDGKRSGKRSSLGASPNSTQPPSEVPLNIDLVSPRDASSDIAEAKDESSSPTSSPSHPSPSSPNTESSRQASPTDDDSTLSRQLASVSISNNNDLGGDGDGLVTPTLTPSSSRPGSRSRNNASFSGSIITPEQAEKNRNQGKAAEDVALRYERHRLLSHDRCQELPFIKDSLSDKSIEELIALNICSTAKTGNDHADSSLPLSDTAPFDIRSFVYLNGSWRPCYLEIKSAKNDDPRFNLSRRECALAEESTPENPYVIYFYQNFEAPSTEDETIVPPTAILIIKSYGDLHRHLEILPIKYRANFKDISKHSLPISEKKLPTNG